MKIINMLPILSFGDAVGNDALAIHHSLQKAGYECVLMADHTAPKIGQVENVRSTADLSIIEPDDVVIYHLSTGHLLNLRFIELKCKKIIRYHNITPPYFFCGYHTILLHNCMDAYNQVRMMAPCADFCLADSAYNKQELIRLGYRCPIEVMPILIPFSDYDKKPDEDIMQQLQDGMTNILFTGRIVPNKRQEDIIAAFDVYQKQYNPNSRLILAGNYEGMEKYYQKLQQYIRDNHTQHVIFSGHISFEAILAYYRSADLFLCMSDHEGFCVPLVEAMYFSVPIIAKEAAAVGETLGDAGILLKDPSPAETAAVMNRVLTDPVLRQKIIQNEKEKLEDFATERVEQQLLEELENFVSGKMRESL